MAKTMERPTPTVAGVEERLRSGDATVTADDLLRAEVAERFGRMKARQEERAATAAAEARRQARIAELRVGIPADLDPAHVGEARVALEEALDAFVATCRAYDGRFAAAVDALGVDPALAPLPPDMAVDGASVRTVVVGGRSFRRAPCQRVIHQAATEAIKRHYGDRHGIDLGRPSD